MRIGILALQGAVSPHKEHLSAAGCESIEVRSAAQLDPKLLDGLIIPGGESTTMLKLLNRFKMVDALKSFAASRPVWGICAGAILAAKHVSSPAQESFQLLDIDVERNSYGRQLDSFSIPLAGNPEVAFIRAPRFTRVGDHVKVLASYNGDPVWVSDGRHMASSFHPELSSQRPSTLHQDFIERCRQAVAENRV